MFVFCAERLKTTESLRKDDHRNHLSTKSTQTITWLFFCFYFLLCYSDCGKCVFCMSRKLNVCGGLKRTDTISCIKHEDCRFISLQRWRSDQEEPAGLLIPGCCLLRSVLCFLCSFCLMWSTLLLVVDSWIFTTILIYSEDLILSVRKSYAVQTCRLCCCSCTHFNLQSYCPMSIFSNQKPAVF